MLLYTDDCEIINALYVYYPNLLKNNNSCNSCNSFVCRIHDKTPSELLYEYTNNRNKYVDDDTYLDQLEFILKGIDDGDIQSSDLNNILDNNFDDDFDFSKGKENFLPNQNTNNNNINGKASLSLKPFKGSSGLRSTGESPIHKKRNEEPLFKKTSEKKSRNHRKYIFR